MAELAHSSHTKPALAADPGNTGEVLKRWGSRVGPAILSVPGDGSLARYGARQVFLIAIAEFAPEANADLFRVYSVAGGRVSPGDIDAWAGRWNLTQGGKCPDWYIGAIRNAVLMWKCPELPAFPPAVIPLDNLILESEGVDTKLHLPVLNWTPLSATGLSDGTSRVMTKTEMREYVSSLIDAELNRIERQAVEIGAEPVPLKRDAQHVEWAVRFQVKRKPIKSLAVGPEHERTVRAAVKDTLSRIGIDQRRERIGRPRKVGN